MKKVDLHVHSNYSDGSDSVKDLAKIISLNKIDIFALTDHDTNEGCKEIIKYLPSDVKFIPSIELTCFSNNIKCHILGYNCNPDDEVLSALIEKGKILRKNKLETRIKYLKDVWNIELTKDELDWLYSRKSVVKTHIANILVKRGLAENNLMAMEKYLDGCKSGDTRFETKEAIDAIHHAGGIAIWAHPIGGEGEEHVIGTNFLEKLEKMIKLGIEGLECFYSRYSEDEIDYLLNIAQKNNLFVSAGSDYHGANKDILIAQTNNKDINRITLLNVL